MCRDTEESPFEDTIRDVSDAVAGQGVPRSPRNSERGQEDCSIASEGSTALLTPLLLAHLYTLRWRWRTFLPHGS